MTALAAHSGAPAFGLRGRCQPNAPMARYCSWRAGGRAQLLHFAADLDDLCALVSSAEVPQPVTFIGLGSNLLVRDGGVRGTLCRLAPGLGSLEDAGGGMVRVGAGAPCPKVARFVAALGFAGAEFLVGIPGTIGGALAMNAGCYGSQIWDFVREVGVIVGSGQAVRRKPEAFHSGYRRLDTEDGSPPRFFSALLGFAVRTCGMQNSAEELLRKRARSQPIGTANAGSVFANPPDGPSAGRLIQMAGLGGAREGAAQVSAKHANFIVNNGGAGAADIERLILLMQRTVREKFGVELRPEVRIIGESL